MTALEVRDLEVILGGRAVVDRVTESVDAGEVVSVMGDNGTGKTTLLRSLVGIVTPTRGEILVAGYDLAREPVAAKARLGYLPDGREELADLLVSELFALLVAVKGAALERAVAVPEAVLATLAVEGLERRRLATLSFGQRRRVMLAAALIGDPDLLVLDEPSNGLDAAGRDDLVALIGERRDVGTAILVATNDPAFEARLGARRFVLAAGKLRGGEACEASLGSP